MITGYIKVWKTHVGQRASIQPKHAEWSCAVPGAGAGRARSLEDLRGQDRTFQRRLDDPGRRNPGVAWAERCGQVNTDQDSVRVPRTGPGRGGARRWRTVAIRLASGVLP